ncbi:hypothetical protein NDU88_001905 [Pleurodeles waltl]|uniref:Uncharacterized protein n=1 Tax=Pleurodeles waltl TaxID=8319 RepID=A0AAV7W0T6_PLEWA|nr:hypothetical protein NDU88_001905 [Pleurodeles waltl]
MRGVRSGQPISDERGELDPLRVGLLSMVSASLLVSECERANVLASFNACAWSTAICDFVGRASEIVGSRQFRVMHFSAASCDPCVGVLSRTDQLLFSCVVARPDIRPALERMRSAN